MNAWIRLWGSVIVDTGILSNNIKFSSQKSVALPYTMTTLHRSDFVPIRDLITELYLLPSKIEKVPRGIRGEKSSKDMATSRNLVSTIGAQASPTMGDGTRGPEG